MIGSIQVVHFEILHFDLPSCTNCGCSKLSLYNGEQFENDFLIGTYCATGWVDNYIQSGGNMAAMAYESYRLAPGTGFAIKYTFFDFAGTYFSTKTLK